MCADDEEAARNLRKHRVDFLDAIAAVEDPNRLEEIEPRQDDGEERTRIIGLARGGVLFVAVTLAKRKRGGDLQNHLGQKGNAK